MRSVLRFLPGVLMCVCVAGVSGCGRSEAVHPVSGKVSWKGAPLSAGIITFVPDTSKGNKTKVSPVGKIESGSYVLKTEGRNGAPMGWYKVTVMTETPGMGGGTTVPTRPGQAVPLTAPGGPHLSPRYKDSNNTPLSIEVVANPGEGAYDLPLQ